MYLAHVVGKLKFIVTISILSTCVAVVLSLPTVSKLRRFLGSELNTLEILQNHIRLKESHLQKITSQLEPLSSVVSGRGARDEYLNNPLHTVTLVRRLTTDWLALANLIGDYSNFRISLSGERDRWALQKEVQSVVRNLARVQLTYNLSTDHLADSVLEETPVNINLTGADCYNVARQYYQQHDHEKAVQWLVQALSKHDNTINRDLVLEMAVLSYCFSGDSRKSESTLSTLLKHFPRHKPSRVLDWQLMINSGCEKAQSVMTRKKNEAASLPPSWTKEYNRLCQGRVNITSDLKCRYVHYNKTQLRLAPFRLEELQIDPPVVLFHNVINDLEIEEAKKKVHNQLEKSRILANNGSSYEDSYRTSETAWIHPEESEILDKLSKKIEDMTNLDTQFAEPHQISRYGLGGEYLFHGDFFGEIPDRVYGDRIATLMFYLPGGHTVFHMWQLSVKPQKGSAVLWFNLKPDGSLDYSSSHAGCSVLKGTKWVLNKWFHELNNDASSPCPVDRKKTHKYFYL